MFFSSRSALLLTAILATIGVTTLSGCAATSVAIAKKDLDVQTKMTATIFLDPVKEADKTILLQVRQPNEMKFETLEPQIKEGILARGYRVVTDPDEAHYYLQISVRAAGRASKTAAQAAMGSAYGSAVSGASTGLLVSTATAGRYGPSSGAAAVGALAGGIIGTIADSVVKDVYFALITDVQIKERLPAGKVAQVTTIENTTQGISGTSTVSANDVTDMRTYQTRVIAIANQVNLKPQDAVVPLVDGITKTVVGIF